MVGHGPFPEFLGDESAGGGRVGHRLLRREGLRGDDEQRARQIRDLLQRVAEVGAVDIGDEMAAQARLRIGRERARAHRRAEVRAADPDVHDVGEGLALRAANRARTDGLREFRDPFALGPHRRHDVMAFRHHRRIGEVAQRHMQRGAVLGNVDDLAREQRGAALLELRRPREIDEQAHRLARHPMLRIVEQQVVERDMKIGEAPGILAEQVGGARLGDIRPMGHERVIGRA